MKAHGDVTRLLTDLSAGKQGADEALSSLVYHELHSLASRYMRGERVGHTLQATALVHEAYLRLAGREAASWESRAQFMGVAARAMRRVLIQHARRRNTDKRGGGRQKITLDESAMRAAEPAPDLLRLDAALDRLMAIHERMGRVVELRYFGGLSVAETARALGTSPMTVKRDWQAAKAWLRTEMGDGDADRSGTS